MFGMLCEVCGMATCRFERTSGVLECNRCHADAEAGTRPAKSSVPARSSKGKKQAA